MKEKLFDWVIPALLLSPHLVLLVVVIQEIFEYQNGAISSILGIANLKDILESGYYLAAIIGAIYAVRAFNQWKKPEQYKIRVTETADLRVLVKDIHSNSEQLLSNWKDIINQLDNYCKDPRVGLEETISQGLAETWISSISDLKFDYDERYEVSRSNILKLVNIDESSELNDIYSDLINLLEESGTGFFVTRGYMKICKLSEKEQDLELKKEIAEKYREKDNEVTNSLEKIKEKSKSLWKRINHYIDA